MSLCFRTTPEPRRPIRLLVADIDGCLSKGGTNPFPPAVMARLVQTNTRSRQDPAYPAVTFCTGRPQPYVECLIQVTHGYAPALCESGVILFRPDSRTVDFHPGFGSVEKRMLQQLHETLAGELLNDHIMPEPGKVTHITLMLTPPVTPADIVDRAREIAARFDGKIAIERTKLCVHFLFTHLDKGTGLQWLAGETGIAPGEMAGIGDSVPDLPFLRMTALSCAPNNAQEPVKQECTCTSSLDDADAMLDFLDYVIEANRALVR